MRNRKPRLVHGPAGSGAAAQFVAGEALGRLLSAWNLPPEAAQALTEAGGACVLFYRAQGAVDP
ncbi:MAG TPA: hypothetical protein VF594_02365, partial [Rubricoccaceae bacterium]